MPNARLLLLAPWLFVPPAMAKTGERPIAIVGAEVFDATGQAPWRGTVVIAGDRIVAAGPAGLCCKKSARRELTHPPVRKSGCHLVMVCDDLGGFGQG